MRVHIVMPLAEERGGAERLLGYLLDDPEAGTVDWSVTFLEDGPMLERARRHGVDADVVEAGRMRDVTRYARTVRALTRRMKATRAEAVLSWMSKAHFYAGPAASIRRLPAVWYQHGFADPSTRSHVALQRIPARGVIATSATVAGLQAAMRPKRPARVVYPAVDPRVTDSAVPTDALRARRELGLPEMGPLIGSVGRFQRWKGFHLLVDALPALCEEWPELACVIVGGDHPREPDYPELVERRAEELGVRTQLVLPGWQEEVAPWLVAMDVFVLLSRHEPFGMVLIESMTAGTPVVATGSAGPSEIFTDGVNGLLVDPTDSAQVSGAIARLLRESELRRSVVAAARERAREFSLERYRRELETAILELAA